MRDRLQHAQIMQSVGGHVVCGQHFRPAEEVSLEINEALLARLHKLGVGLDFLGQHAAAPRPVPLDQLHALERAW